MDAFDKLFAGTGVRASVRRKMDDGTTRSARLADGAVPDGLSLASFADAAMKGSTLGKRGIDRGAGLSMSVSVKGAAARSAILAMGDAVEVPQATARRGRNVEPSANGVHNTEPAAS